MEAATMTKPLREHPSRDLSTSDGSLVRRSFLKAITISVVGAPLLQSAVAHGKTTARTSSLAGVKPPTRAPRKQPRAKLPPSFRKRFPAHKLVTRGRIPPMTGELEVSSVSVMRGEKAGEGKSLSVVPPGRKSMIVVNVRTSGKGKISMPWRIEIDGKEHKSGVKKAVAGREFQISVPWTPSAGDHRVEVVVDPDNVCKEAAAGVVDNRRIIPVAVNSWGEWIESFLDAVTYAVEMWKMQAHFQNILINAQCALGNPGCLAGPSLKSLIKQAPMASSIPTNIRDGLATGMAASFREWQDAVTVPGLPWYPPFVAFPGPYAPPMPNVPTPIIACLSNKMSSIVDPSRLKSSLSAGLGSAGSTDEAKAAVDCLAATLSVGFLTWLCSAQVMLVMGHGPVPTYAPPYVPVGQVLGGSVIPSPGHLLTSSSVSFHTTS